MRFFPLLDFQHVVLLIFLGLIALILLWVAFGGEAYWGKRKEEEGAEEYPEGIRTQNRPIPLILIFVYLGLAVWAVAYVILVGIRGTAF